MPGSSPAFLGLSPGKQEQQQEVSSSVSGLSIPARALPHPSHHSETPTKELASPTQHDSNITLVVLRPFLFSFLAVIHWQL